MDIRKWLDETVSPPRPPSLPEQLSLPPFLRPKERVEEPLPRGTRRRKRGTSDSSILETHQRRRKGPPVEYESEGDQTSACSDTSTSSRHSSGSSSSSRRYARRPRRKTRLERYDPKPEDAKERGKQPSGKKRRDSKKSRRKSRRKTEARGAGRVQNFQPKNVPRDRLTVCRPSFALLLWDC